MEAVRILEAAEFYQKKISGIMEKKGFDISPLRLEPHEKIFSTEQKLNHLLWLAQEVPNLISQGKINKAMRWVCFIQGALWGLDFSTIC